ELSLLDEALDSCSKAETIDPSNFVFPMYRAAILLDFGRAQEALQSVQRALALQPGNTAAAGYEQLAKWDLGDKDAIRKLNEIIPDIPIGVQSRVAIRLDLQPLQQFEQLDEINQPLPVPFGATLQKLRLPLQRNRTNRIHKRVTELIQAGRFEKAIHVLS